MILTIQGYNINFGYKSVLKSEWKKGNMPSVTKGIYGGTLTKGNVSLEHLIPHSKGGKTDLANLALAVDKLNWKRADKPLNGFLTKDMIESYLAQFKDVNLPDFKGSEYIEKVSKTLARLLK